MNRPDIARANWLFVLACAGLLLISLAAASFGGVSDLLLNTAYYLPFMALPAVLILKGKTEAARLKPAGLMTMLGAAALAVVAVFFFSNISALWTAFLTLFGIMPSELGIEIPANASELTLSVFTVGVLPGVCEELVYRGVILSAWEKRGTWRALMVSSLLFTLMHGSIEALPAHFLTGMLVGYVVICTDSVYAGMAYHTAYNVSIMCINYIGGADAASEALFYSDPVAYLGGGVGILMLFFETLLMAGVMLLLLRTYARRRKLTGVEIAPKTQYKLSVSELVPLIAGVVITIIFYGITLSYQLGGAA